MDHQVARWTEAASDLERSKETRDPSGRRGVAVRATI